MACINPSTMEPAGTQQRSAISSPSLSAEMRSWPARIAMACFGSTDDGATWVASEPQVGYIPCLAADDAHAYLGCESGIYVSGDDGATWSLGGWVPGPPLSMTIQGEYVFVGTTAGISRSSDNGMSWTPAKNGLGNRRVNAIAAAQSEIFAGTEGGVFKSTDMGSTWSAASNGLTDSLILSHLLLPTMA